eukprot:TRINITY_DN273_c1_g1_i1.p1 TRINITY_DN273_c1_g1~~TRINITY_DN273_c1_g1_i1.p1  ORF type:complete len:527 (-),score=173.97 TRINITY_DN273_c1_g1_i1:32-1612(-)
MSQGDHEKTNCNGPDAATSAAVSLPTPTELRRAIDSLDARQLALEARFESLLLAAPVGQHHAGMPGRKENDSDDDDSRPCRASPVAASPTVLPVLSELSRAVEALRADHDALLAHVEAQAQPSAAPAPKERTVDAVVAKLNVGGVHYVTTRSTLSKYPDSMLGALFSGRFQLQLDDEGRVFIDRDGDVFGAVLSFLRVGRWLLPPEPHAVERIRAEAEYFGLPWPEPELDIGTVRCKAQLLGHQAKITALLVWNGRLVSADYDRTVRVWTPDRKCVGVVDVGEPFMVAVWRNDYLATVTDTLIRLWNAECECTRAVVTSVDEGVPMAVQVWRDRLVCGFYACADIRVWMSDFEDSRVLRGHREEVSSLAEWGGNLVSADDRDVRIWDWDCQCLHVVKSSLGQGVSCLTVHNDHLFITQRATIQVYNAAFALECALCSDDEALPVALTAWHGYVVSYSAAAGFMDVWSADQFWNADERERSEAGLFAHPVLRLKTTVKVQSGTLAVWDGKLVSSEDRVIKIWDGRYS